MNVVNGSFRADAARSLIVTPGFMGNLPVNFSGSSPLENTLYNVHWSNCKWPACNTSQRATNAIHFPPLLRTRGGHPQRKLLSHLQFYNCPTSSPDFPASSRLYLSNVLQARVEYGAQAFSCARTVKQYTSSQINYEACLR